MTAYLEVCKPSGSELVVLAEQRVTVGKDPSNAVVLGHDPTVSRLHAVFENYGSSWSVRDLGSRNGTYVNGVRILLERVLRPGDELRLGNSRLIYRGEQPTGTAIETLTAQPAPDVTRRERDVLVALCRSLFSDEPFTQPASVRQIAAELVVTEAAIKQHLLHLYDKFDISAEGDRRVHLANEAIRRGVVTAAMLRRQ